MSSTTHEYPAVRGAAIVLAAGASSRFEGVVKATLPVLGEPAVRRIVRLAHQGGFDPVVLVVGAHPETVTTALGDARAQVVVHPDWASGRTGSLAAGIDAVGHAEAVLVWPVDHPFANATTVHALRTRADGDALGVWFIPMFAGRGGHPVVIRRPVFDAIRGLPADAPLRSLLPYFGPQVVRFPVRDSGVVANIDTREAYDRATAESTEGPWTGD